MASFYDRFRLEPAGRHVVEVCEGTSCHSRGSRVLLERLEKELGVDPGQTDKSGRFTLRTVRCLGLCALSPAMKIDGRSFGRVNIDRVPGDVGAIRMSVPIRNSADLDQARAAGKATLHPQRLKILVGSASCGVAVGAREVEAAARRAVEELGLDAVVAAPAASGSARASRCWISCFPTARGSVTAT